jgi:hypothetical protein
LSDEPPSGAEITAQFEAARTEVTERAQAGPTRPEGHPTENSVTRVDGPGGSLEQAGREAVALNRQINKPYAERNADIAAALEIAKAAKESEDAALQAKEQEKGKGGNER